MHKTRYNALQVHLEVRPRGPLLIKSGGLSANPALPDMQFVRTYRTDLGETVYLPGSSLKGALRGFCEKVLRTIDEPDGWRRSCSTFPADPKSCGKRLETEEDSAAVYCQSCGACRLFGHTRLRGRLSCSDFFPVAPVRTETRYGVALSRLTHAVAQGPFELEAVVDGAFVGHVNLENFELWQLGLLALVLTTLDRGFLKLGFGKNRGFGDVAVVAREVVVDEVVRDGSRPEPTVLRGLGAFVTLAERERYGLAGPDRLADLPPPARVEDLVLYHRRTYDAAGWQALAQQTMASLAGEEQEGEHG